MAKPDEFFFQGADDKGHSSFRRIRLLPQMDQAIQEIFDSRDNFNLPYRSLGDVLRDAIWHRIEELQEMKLTNNRTDNFMSRARIIQNMLHEEEEGNAFLDIIKKLDERIRILPVSGGTAEERHTLNLVSGIIKQVILMPAGYWRNRLIDELTTKFGGKEEIAKLFSWDTTND